MKQTRPVSHELLMVVMLVCKKLW